MYISLNEVTVNGSFMLCDDDRNAKDYIIEIVKFIKAIKQNNIEGMILSVDIYSWLISNSYNLNEWFLDSNVPKEYKQFIRVYLGKNIQMLELDDDLCELRFIVDRKEYKSDGAVWAAKNSHPMFSVAVKAPWTESTLMGELYEINDDGNVGICEVHLTNLSLNSASTEIKRIVSNIEYESISSGYDLWEQRKKLFPNLVFCECVKKQLYDDPERFHIVRIMEKLMILQQYFSSCGCNYDPKNIGIYARTESENVKTNPKLKELRKFYLPSGKKSYFFNHISFTGKFTGGRIHFLPDCPNRRCYIGYIGRHLPTSKF